MRLIFYIALIFGQVLCGQTQVLTDPLSLSSRSIAFYESLGQSVIGNTTSSGVTLYEGIGYLLDT